MKRTDFVEIITSHIKLQRSDITPKMLYPGLTLLASQRLYNISQFTTLVERLQ